MFFIGWNGNELQHRQRVNVDTDADVYPGYRGLAVQPNGNLIAAYTQYGKQRSIVHVRRFNAKGLPLGKERLARHPYFDVSQGGPAIATAPDGSYLVVWGEWLPESYTFGDYVVAQHFSPDGKPLCDPVILAEGSLLDVGALSVAADDLGNFFITWQGSDRTNSDPFGWEIYGRQVWADDTLGPGPIRLNQERQDGQHYPQTAFGSNRTVIVGWGSYAPSQRRFEMTVPIVRRFIAER